jgi:hypothetical protein
MEDVGYVFTAYLHASLPLLVIVMIVLRPSAARISQRVFHNDSPLLGLLYTLLEVLNVGCQQLHSVQ